MVNAHCAGLAGAECSNPWGGGHDAWKVGGRIFALIGAQGRGVSLKTPDIESAQWLIASGAAERAPYLHRSWVLVPWGAMDEMELKARITRSHAIVTSGLPRKLRPPQA
jgi:predicted DNA-binding protein (MmcQ/YjbR family)